MFDPGAEPTGSKDSPQQSDALADLTEVRTSPRMVLQTQQHGHLLEPLLQSAALYENLDGSAGS